MIELTPVTGSSQIAKYGYDSATSKLYIQFHGRHHKGNDADVPGSLYEYDDVPPEHHEGLMSADSIGSYFRQHIKGGGYAFRKLEIEEVHV